MSDIQPQGNKVSAFSLQISDNSLQISPSLIIIPEDDKFYANELLKAVNELMPDFPLKKRPTFRTKIHFIFFVEKIIKILKQSNTQNISSIMDEIKRAFYNRFHDLMSQKQVIFSQSLAGLKSRQNEFKRKKIIKIEIFLYIFEKCISEGHRVAINQLYQENRKLYSAYKEFSKALNQEETLNYQPDDIEKYNNMHSIIDTNDNICFWEDTHNFIFYFQFIKSAEYQKSRNFKNKRLNNQGFPKKQKPITKQTILLKQKPSDMHLTKRLPQNSEDSLLIKLQQNIPKKLSKKSNPKTNGRGFQAYKLLLNKVQDQDQDQDQDQYQDQDQNYNTSNRTKQQKSKTYSSESEPEYQKSNSHPDKNVKIVEQIDKSDKIIAQEINQYQFSPDSDGLAIKRSMKRDQYLIPDYSRFIRKLYTWCISINVQLPTKGFMRYNSNRIAIIAIFLQIQQSKGMMWFADHQKDYHQFLKQFKMVLQKLLNNPKMVEPDSDAYIEITLVKKQIPTFKESYSRFLKGDKEGALKILFRSSPSENYFKQALKKLKFIQANIPIRRGLLSVADRLDNAFPKRFIKKEFGVQILNEKLYEIKEVKKENGNVMMLDEENKQFWELVAEEISKKIGAVIQFIKI